MFRIGLLEYFQAALAGFGTESFLLADGLHGRGDHFGSLFLLSLAMGCPSPGHDYPIVCPTAAKLCKKIQGYVKAVITATRSVSRTVARVCRVRLIPTAPA